MVLEYLPSVGLIYQCGKGLFFFLPLQTACLKRGWTCAVMDVWGGKYDWKKSNFEDLEIELGCPAYQHIPPLARYGGFCSSGALYLRYVCRSDGIRPAPQTWTHQRTPKRVGQSDCKRPSYINGAKVLCFIWTCLDLFVCTPHSPTLGEIQSTVFPPALNTCTMQLVDAGL